MAIDELLSVIADKRRWQECHALFRRIRSKTLQADATHDGRLIAQYAFEEVCAKSIYNVSDGTGPYPPFDADWPFNVIPLAFKAARTLGIDRDRIVAIVAGE